MGLVLFLFFVGKVKDNLKLSVWDEPMQKSFVVVGVLAVVETVEGRDMSEVLRELIEQWLQEHENPSPTKKGKGD